MLHLGIYGDEGGPAAQTGSLAHVGIERYHATKSAGAALDAMASTLDKFPLADKDDAERHVRDYCEDPRNQTAEIDATEMKIDLVLGPWPDDPTKLPIRIHGTLDQIRLEGGVKYVWDVKTGGRPGFTMVHEYAHQIAAYAIGAGCEPGGMIRTQGYRRRGVKAADAPDGVFFRVPFNLAQCHVLLDDIRREVANIRRGECRIGPGDHCGWCPAGDVGGCLADLGRLCA